MIHRISVSEALLLEAAARDALGDPGAAESALERALDIAEPDGAVLPFLLHPVPALLERHPRHRTAHPSLIAEILSLLAGASRAAAVAGPAAGAARAAQRERDPRPALPAHEPLRARDRG